MTSRTPPRHDLQRTTAHRIFAKMQRKNGHLDRLIDEAAKRFPRLRRSVVKRIVLEALRYEPVASVLLGQKLRRYSRLPNPVKDALVIGLIEIVDSGSKHQENIAREYRTIVQKLFPKLASVVGGTLRDFAPEDFQNACQELDVMQSALPSHLVQAIKEFHPKESSDINDGQVAAFLEQPKLAFWARPESKIEEDFGTPHDWIPGHYKAKIKGSPTRWPGFHEGAFQIQDGGSVLVSALLDVKDGERILDACAAPGGKTINLAYASGPKGELVALELQEKRMARLLDNIKRLTSDSCATIRVENQSIEDFAQNSTDNFDAVLVDAPCSALGTFRRHPEIRYRDSLKDHSRSQLSILSASASCVKSGGRLVYATCSPLRAENEDIVEEFLRSELGESFSILPASEILSYLPENACSESGWLRLWPDLHGTDAFSAVVLTRKDVSRSSLKS